MTKLNIPNNNKNQTKFTLPLKNKTRPVMMGAIDRASAIG
jgi:hypothetical protein